MAAPLGNQYAAKDKRWRKAILRALEKRSTSDQLEALDEIADKLIDACRSGDLGALKELGDRLDGKPAQTVDVGNKDGEAFQVVQRTIVDPRNSNA